MAVAGRSSAGRDILLETWLISQMRTPIDVTPDEYCRALEELAPARLPAAILNRPLPNQAIPA